MSEYWFSKSLLGKVAGSAVSKWSSGISRNSGTAEKVTGNCGIPWLEKVDKCSENSEVGKVGTISSSRGKKSRTPIRSAEVLVLAVVMTFGSELPELSILMPSVDSSALASPSDSKFVSDHLFKSQSRTTVPSPSTTSATNDRVTWPFAVFMMIGLILRTF